MTMGVNGYRYKKDLKASVGKPLQYEETCTAFGFPAEYRSTGSFCVVGPDAHRKRDWFATVHMVDDIIVKVE